MRQRFLRVLKAQLVLLITSIMFFTTGCEDDDHDHDHDEGHTDAEGFVLETESGTVVYRQFEGDVDAALSGVSVAVGETLELLVHFLDHDGDEIEHDDDEHEADESELEVTVTGGSSFATVEVEEHDETGSSTEHHEMALEITGLAEGTTTFSLSLVHGTHEDYASTVDVPVTVTSGN